MKASGMSQQEYRSEVLTAKNVQVAARLAAAAFANTPCYTEILPGDERERVSFLEWLFEKNFSLRLDDDCGRCTYDGDTLISFFMFVKPDVRHPTFCDMIKAGLILGLWSYGYSAVQRLLSTKIWFEEKEEEVLGDRAGTMIRVERMTVLPSYQGKGVGSHALRAALRESDELGIPCILGTQEERNVTFYSRLGFEVVDESHCPIGRGYTNWPVQTSTQV